jgi:hypothetical protein
MHRHAGTAEARQWATRTLAQWHKIRATTMSQWLAEKTVVTRVSRNMASASRSLQRLARVAGPIGIAVAVGLDAYEISSHVRAYQRGDLSQRQMMVAVASSGGGIVGGVVGAKAGAVAGAWIGSFGGPFAWLTVPGGAIAGGTIGGVLGYYGGSTVTGTIAEAWYAKVDERVKAGVDKWIIRTPYLGLASQSL